MMNAAPVFYQSFVLIRLFLFKQKTAYEMRISDWSSDVCSSDLAIRGAAARRLRPILMTSIATVMGAVPLVMMGGAGAESRASIGVVIVSGVSLATLITLFLIPILYSRLAGRTVSPQTVGRELDAALEAQKPAE